MRLVLFLVVLGAALYVLFRELFAEGKRRAERRELAARSRLREEKAIADATTVHGGSPDDPILVASPSVVEAEATGQRCLACGTVMRVDEHAAETFGDTRLRVAHLRCPQCGATRALHFRIGLPS